MENWNSEYQNWKGGEKLECVVHEVCKAGLTICGLQEVRRLGTGSAVISSVNKDTKYRYEIYWSGYSLKRIHGVGIAIRVDSNIDILEVTPVNARIIVADVLVRDVH